MAKREIYPNLRARSAEYCVRTDFWYKKLQGSEPLGVWGLGFGIFGFRVFGYLDPLGIFWLSGSRRRTSTTRPHWSTPWSFS